MRAELRVPRLATADLRGMVVVGTEAIGKHLLTRLAGGGRALTLHHHLRMDGSWRTGEPGPPRARAHEIRAWLVTGRGQAVGVRVHDLALVTTREERKLVGHLGPDIMAHGFDVDVAADRLRRSGLQLVAALLDQRLVAGLGTMWACELAAAAGVNPHVAAEQVADLDHALGLIRTRMLAALDQPAGPRRAGLAVFERTRQPCRRCGTAIVATRVGQPPLDRPTYWCPRCQAG